MKTLKFILIFCILYNRAYSQDNFKIGVEHFQKGKYELADTFFTRHLKQNPHDKDALFNRSVIKLLYKDTCSCCMDLFAINYPWESDKEALKRYFSLCGHTDTVSYYDRKFNITNKKDCRYFEVIEHHKYYDKVRGTIHDRKRTYEVNTVSYSKTMTNLFQLESCYTDIIAWYELISDSSKVYSLTGSPPLFPGGEEKYRETIDKVSELQNIKNDMNIPGTVVYYSFIIDKMGKSKDFQIMRIVPERLLNPDKIIRKLTQLYNEIPDFIPGKFRDQPVDYYMLESIAF